MPETPDAVTLAVADRERWLVMFDGFLRDPSVTAEIKEDFVTATAIALRNAADMAGYYA